jgi:hypothetical protein
VLHEAYRRTGVKPPALASQPRLRGECETLYTAYCALSASRDNNGFGASPIKVSEVRAYALMMGLNLEEGLKLLRVVQAMDGAYLEYQAQKNKTS